MAAASLAETLYAAWWGEMHAWRTDDNNVETFPQWDDVDARTRAAWEHVAEVARAECAKAEVAVDFESFRAAANRIHEEALASSGIEPSALTPPWPVHDDDEVVHVTVNAASFSCKDCGKTVEVEAVRCSACTKVPPAPVIGDRFRVNGQTMTVTSISMTFAEGDPWRLP